MPIHCSIPFDRLALPQVQQTLRWVLFGVMIVCIYSGIVQQDNDFYWHRDQTQKFLAGQPGNHYLPGRWLINSIAAWMPYRVDRAVVLLTSLTALAATMAVWTRLIIGDRPQHGDRTGSAITLTLVFVLTYLHRDLMECGLQILLLFLLTAAAYALHRGQLWACGFWLATAAIYKVTPILFLPFLLFKRQWTAAAATAIFVVLWCLAPAFVLGWRKNIETHEEWFTRFRALSNQADPCENGVEPPTHRSQALGLSIARVLQTYPPGHPLHLTHPAFVQFLDLPVKTAKQTVQGVLLLIALGLSWNFRRPYSQQPRGHRFAMEWAIVCLFCAIMSPLCWIQHLVLVIPLVYLWVERWSRVNQLKCLESVVTFGILIVMLAFHKDTFGGDLYQVVISYKPHLIAVALLTGLVLYSDPKSTDKDSVASHSENVQ